MLLVSALAVLTFWALAAVQQAREDGAARARPAAEGAVSTRPLVPQHPVAFTAATGFAVRAQRSIGRGNGEVEMWGDLPEQRVAEAFDGVKKRATGQCEVLVGVRADRPEVGICGECGGMIVAEPREGCRGVWGTKVAENLEQDIVGEGREIRHGGIKCSGR